MPDKTELDGFRLAHDVFDLAGRGGFSSSSPPYVPGTDGLMDDEPFDGPPEDPDFAQVIWDFETETLLALEEESDDGYVPISPFDRSMYFDDVAGDMLYWDKDLDDFVIITLDDFIDYDELVFTTPPRAVNPDEESSPVTVEHRDIQNNPVTIGVRPVYLYSTDPDLVFYFGGSPVTGVVLENGDSSVTFTYMTPTAGNPVITASLEELV